MPCCVLAEVPLVDIVSSSVFQFGVFTPASPVLQYQYGSSPRSSVWEPPQQPCPAQLHCLCPCPGPCAAATHPTGSGCAPAAQAVSGWLHQACQAFSRQWLALESRLKRKLVTSLRFRQQKLHKESLPAMWFDQKVLGCDHSKWLGC